MSHPGRADPAGTRVQRPPSTPRWVKIIGVVVAVLLLVIVIVLVSGGDDDAQHGPGRHAGPAGTSHPERSAPESSAVAPSGHGA